MAILRDGRYPQPVKKRETDESSDHRRTARFITAGYLASMKAEITWLETSGHTKEAADAEATYNATLNTFKIRLMNGG
ncbi:hypothetical protein FIV00_14900 [Labrenzia sp. THAF82]|uniref:hypothetical protein n=1 Tax=Labrenzia sp. THAF82 TaxID=2587861 RepID=UPI0012686E6B|nr:hypothetical protein [Labrenzia sp. THAF82]QFT31778.1 hypothetical protein FIV00_14900 [Labrenzia sp. THAF82]